MQLSSWPVPAIAALFALAGVAGMVLLGMLASRCNPWRHSTEGQDAVQDVTKLIGGVVGLFLVFVLTQSMAYYREAETATSKEAGNILQLDHALAGIAPAAGSGARARLHEYVASIVNDEWPAMRNRSRGSDSTEQAFTRLRLAVADILLADPAAASLRNLQKDLDDVEDDRTARLGAAESTLPAGLWQIIGSLFGLLAASMFLMTPNTRLFRVFGLYVTSLVLLAALFYMVDGPYRGDFSVSPRALQGVLARTAGP